MLIVYSCGMIKNLGPCFFLSGFEDDNCGYGLLIIYLHVK